MASKFQCSTGFQRVQPLVEMKTMPSRQQLPVQPRDLEAREERRHDVQPEPEAPEPQIIDSLGDISQATAEEVVVQLVNRHGLDLGRLLRDHDSGHRFLIFLESWQLIFSILCDL